MLLLEQSFSLGSEVTGLNIPVLHSDFASILWGSKHCCYDPAVLLLRGKAAKWFSAERMQSLLSPECLSPGLDLTPFLAPPVPPFPKASDSKD